MSIWSFRHLLDFWVTTARAPLLLAQRACWLVNQAPGIQVAMDRKDIVDSLDQNLDAMWLSPHGCTHDLSATFSDLVRATCCRTSVQMSVETQLSTWSQTQDGLAVETEPRTAHRSPFSVLKDSWWCLAEVCALRVLLQFQILNFHSDQDEFSPFVNTTLLCSQEIDQHIKPIWLLLPAIDSRHVWRASKQLFLQKKASEMLIYIFDYMTSTTITFYVCSADFLTKAVD